MRDAQRRRGSRAVERSAAMRGAAGGALCRPCARALGRMQARPRWGTFLVTSKTRCMCLLTEEPS